MADWTGSRVGRFFGRYVDWDTWEETANGEYPYIVGGSLELSSLSATKASGTLRFDGKAPDPSKLLRIYYEFEDANGEKETLAVCTMLLEVSTDDRTDAASSGSAKMESVLKVLQDRHHGAPYVVPAGANAVEKAVEICRSLGLVTNDPVSDYVLARQKVFTADEADYLGIVNWLLDAAGFYSASVAPDGMVLFDPYIETVNAEPAYTFQPGPSSVMLPEITVTSDWQQSPNAVRLVFETEHECLSAYALNMDPGSESSLPNRGMREKTLFETVTEVEGIMQADRLANLIAAAEAKLVGNSAKIEKVEISCPYLPLKPNDAVEFKYAGIDWKGSVTNFTVDFGDDSSSRLSARRFARTALKTETGGAILWSI